MQKKGKDLKYVKLAETCRIRANGLSRLNQFAGSVNNLFKMAITLHEPFQRSCTQM